MKFFARRPSSTPTTRTVDDDTTTPWWRRRSDTSIHQTCDKNDREEEEERFSSPAWDQQARGGSSKYGPGPTPQMFTTTLRPRRAPLATIDEGSSDPASASAPTSASAASQNAAGMDDDVLSNMLGVVGSREFFAEFFEQPGTTKTGKASATLTTTTTVNNNSSGDSKSNHNNSDWKDPRVQRKLVRLHEEFQRELQKLETQVHPSACAMTEDKSNDQAGETPGIHAAETSSVLSGAPSTTTAGSPHAHPQLLFNKFRARNNSYKSLPAPALPTIPSMVVTNDGVTATEGVTASEGVTAKAETRANDLKPPSSFPSNELPDGDPNSLIQWLQERRSLLEEIRHRTDQHVQRWKSVAQQEVAKREYLQKEFEASRDSSQRQLELHRLEMLRWKEEEARTSKDQDAKVEFYQQQVHELLTRQSVLLQKNHRYREELVLLLNENDGLKRMLKSSLDRLEDQREETRQEEEEEEDVSLNTAALPETTKDPLLMMEQLRSQVEYWKKETQKGQRLCKEMVEELALRELSSSRSAAVNARSAPGEISEVSSDETADIVYLDGRE